MSKTRCVKKKMPQLDKLIFVDQVINGLVLFIIVYYMNIYMILPTLAYILKFREKKRKNLKKTQNILINEIKYMNNKENIEVNWLISRLNKRIKKFHKLFNWKKIYFKWIY